MDRRRIWTTALIALIGGWLIGWVAAQEPQPQAAPAAAPAPAPKYYEALIVQPVVPARTMDAIQADLKRADEDRQKAEKSVAECQAQVIEADGWIKMQKMDIEAIKGQIDAAKKEKREADKAALEAKKKEQELVLDFLEELKSVREAAFNLAKTQQVHAGAARAAGQAELDLAQKRGTWAGLPAGDPGAATAARSALMAEESVNKAMKDLADKQIDVVSQQKKLNDCRVDLTKARTLLLNDERLKAAKPPVPAP